MASNWSEVIRTSDPKTSPDIFLTTQLLAASNLSRGKDNQLTSESGNEIVYGAVWGNLVLMPREDAVRLAALRQGLYSARTWGELKARLQDHAGLYEEVLEELRWANEDDDDYVEPKDEDEFDADQMPGYGDGDWPASPLQTMMECIPGEVQREYGRIASNMVSGNWLELDPDFTAEIVAALQAHGYACIEDEALVNACFV